MFWPGLTIIISLSYLLIQADCAVLSNESNGNTKFPTHSLYDHPFHTVLQWEESSDRPQPVIMKSYFVIKSGAKVFNKMIFVPRASSYKEFPSKELSFYDLDALIIPKINQDATNKDTFLHVELNDKARVWLVMTGKGLKKKTLINGVTLNGEGIIDSMNLETIRSLELQDVDRTFGLRKHKLPRFAVAMEISIPSSHSLILPHPNQLSANGVKMEKYALLFAQKVENIIVPFDQPSVPDPYTAFVGDEFDVRPFVDPSMDIPEPNKWCPTWLHDLYVTPSRSTNDERSTTGEPAYWRTWHPMIDPFYWCYFDHEHGSYPGKYSPMFEYTAWKKGDEESHTGRQLESHAGFKIFSFPVPKKNEIDENRAVVATLHQHLSRPRRVITRTHTMIFAVLNMDRDWEIEMELHFKMDFGPAQATYANKSTKPMTQKDWGIKYEMDEQKINAGRRINVLNLTDFPDSVDKKFKTRKNGKSLKTISKGIYEQWKGTLRDCTSSNRKRNFGFLFETRDPGTGLKDIETLAEQTLSGKSVNRLLKVRRVPLKIGLEHCKFDEPVQGKFYTNPDMTTLKENFGVHNVRQYLKKDFKEVELPSGNYVYMNEWNPSMSYVNKENGRFRIVEDAVDALQN